MDADQLNARLEDLAASIEGGASFEATSFSFECLSTDVSSVLGIMSDMLQYVPLCACPCSSAPLRERERERAVLVTEVSV